MDALLYKIHNDPYYRDVRVDSDAVEELPENATDISHMLNSVTLPDIDDETEFAMFTNNFVCIKASKCTTRDRNY